MRREIPLGLLYSVTGTYGAIGRDALDGALLALDEINADSAFPFAFKAMVEDPAANIDAYHRLCEAMLNAGGCRHIIGTITSISRKEVIPIIEKHDALLWYMLPYEGFEACENVIYTGACPNQHIVPLFRRLLPRFGKRVYLIGSNYIWGWEVNRVARELIQACGGEVLGERYLPFDSTDVERPIEEIRATGADFVLNNLVGSTSYVFLQAYHRAAQSDPGFAPERRPVVSANLTEAELDLVGFEAAAGHLSSAIYFDSLATPQSRAFVKRVRARFGPQRRVSAYVVNAYNAVRLLAESIRAAGSDDIEAVKRALAELTFETPLGPLRIDGRTNHAALRPYIGRFQADGRVEIVEAEPEPIPADPYLVDFDAAALAREIAGGGTGHRGQPNLRLVK